MLEDSHEGFDLTLADKLTASHRLSRRSPRSGRRTMANGCSSSVASLPIPRRKSLGFTAGTWSRIRQGIRFVAFDAERISLFSSNFWRKLLYNYVSREKFNREITRFLSVIYMYNTFAYLLHLRIELNFLNIFYICFGGIISFFFCVTQLLILFKVKIQNACLMSRFGYLCWLLFYRSFE